MKTLRWILAAQLLFFAAWGGYLLNTHRIAATVWLETAPVDPRDLLSGHYVALAYPIAANADELCAKLRQPDEPGTFYLRLDPSTEVVTTVEGPVHVSTAVECRVTPPDSGGIWIEGEHSAGRGFGRVTFGIERFYVAESSPLRWATSGEVVAKIAINDTREPRILALVQRVPIEDAAAFGSTLSSQATAR